MDLTTGQHSISLHRLERTRRNGSTILWAFFRFTRSHRTDDHQPPTPIDPAPDVAVKEHRHAGAVDRVAGLALASGELRLRIKLLMTQKVLIFSSNPLTLGNEFSLGIDPVVF